MRGPRGRMEGKDERGSKEPMGCEDDEPPVKGYV